MSEALIHWEVEDGVRCVSCPSCAFTFDAGHTDDTPEGGYSCPNCGFGVRASTTTTAEQSSPDSELAALRVLVGVLEGALREARDFIAYPGLVAPDSFAETHRRELLAKLTYLLPAAVVAGGEAAPKDGPGCERHKGEPHNLCPECWKLEPGGEAAADPAKDYWGVGGKAINDAQVEQVLRERREAAGQREEES